MLNEVKSRFVSGEKLFFIVLGLITITNAQGITNTLGGNTSTDKFIVENSDSKAGLVITGDQNVGIGLANPYHKLTVYDESQARIAVQSDYSGTGYSDGLQIIHGQGTNGQSWIINYEDHHLHIGTNGNNDITIEDGGQIGIQTTSPGANLDVNGDVILGESGTRFMEIQEITGTTGSLGDVTDYSNGLPEGWTGAKTRLLSLEILYNGGHWYAMGFENTEGKIAARFEDTSREFTVYFPGQPQFRNQPWRAMIMRMP